MPKTISNNNISKQVEIIRIQHNTMDHRWAYDPRQSPRHGCNKICPEKAETVPVRTNSIHNRARPSMFRHNWKHSCHRSCIDLVVEAAVAAETSPPQHPPIQEVVLVFRRRSNRITNLAAVVVVVMVATTTKIKIIIKIDKEILEIPEIIITTIILRIKDVAVEIFRHVFKINSNKIGRINTMTIRDVVHRHP